MSYGLIQTIGLSEIILFTVQRWCR